MLEAYGISDQGCVRKNNEDYYLIDSALGLFALADGMGGAQGGEHASRLAIETVAERLASSQRAAADLVEAFEEANRRVITAAAENPRLEGMGTTLVALIECDGQVIVASVGDSRAYQFRPDGLSVITQDQTWVQDVGRRLGLTEEALKVHPLRHVLTMAVGVVRTLRVQTYSLTPEAGDQYLLSSDGLHGVVPPEIIADVLSSRQSLAAKGHYLVEAARRAGGPDNITAVILRSPD